MHIRQHIDSKLLARLEKIEQEIIAAISTQKVIGNALLIGDPAQSHLLQECRSQCRYVFSSEQTPNQHTTDPLCLGKMEQLPYLKESLDLVVTPHSLEFSPNPSAILSEITSTLSRKGVLLVLGFSSWNYLSLQKESSASFHSFSDIKHAISAAGLTITATRPYFSLAAQCSDSPAGKIFDKIAAPYLPFLCSAYYIVAQTFVAPVTPQPFGLLAKQRFALAFEGKGCST